MKMAMLLLVSALSVLVIPAVPNPTHQRLEPNLNLIIDLAEKYNESLTKVRPHLISTVIFLLVKLLLTFFMVINVLV